MNKNFKVFIFFLILCLLPLKLPAQDPSPFGNSKITISMDFQDANLKDVVKIFSIQSGLNFIASEAVQDRKITLYLDKVPIKEAMDKLFKANNLTYELDEQAKIFIVKDWGKPEIDTITKVFYLKYATVSTSSLIAEKSSQMSSTGTSGSSTSSSTSSSSTGSTTGIGSSGGSSGGSTGQNAGIINAVKKNLTTNGSVIEDSRTNSLIVTDVPNRMPVIEKLIASLDMPAPQVMLEVEMLDVSKNIVDKIGLEFGNNPFTFIYPGNPQIKAFLGDLTYRGLTIPSTAGAIVFGRTYAEVLDFLRTRTDTKFLARPRLLTLNNETAEIKITTDEAVGEKKSISGETGNTTTTTEAERYETGVSLRITPQINLDTGEITMFIVPTVAEASSSGITSSTGVLFYNPETRSTKSIVRVKDGETVILGGLIRNESSQTIKKLPILGDIPILGTLFRHKNKTKDKERELLVFITPHIIKDTNVDFAQAGKTSLLAKEQITASPVDRRLAIDASLNSFEKLK